MGPDFVEDAGLVSIAGGKLTTFRPMARQALALGLGNRSSTRLRPEQQPVFRRPAPRTRPAGLSRPDWQRLCGYYGDRVGELLAEGEPETVADTQVFWNQLRWACRHEAVVHLDDLLLRRTRLGLILPEGGAALLPDIRHQCQPLLGWTDARWQQEESRYRQIYRNAYSLPEDFREASHDR